MYIAGIAINADAARLDGSAAVLRQELDYYRECGFSYVEIAPHGAGVVINGRLLPGKLAELRAVLARFPLQYTVHGPNPLNLMDRDDGDLHYRLFVSSLEFAAALRSPVLVYHAGRYLPEERFQLPHAVLLTPAEKSEMWRREREQLRKLGDVATRYGVTIAVENARPYLDASPYCYGEFLNQLAAMVREVDHPQVGVTLDMGHAFLAARFHRYDLLAGVAAVAPYVRHIHMHDNCGKACASYEKKQYEMAATGRGDMHMPIGWGAVPAAAILERLGNYHGVVTLEMRPRYRAYYGETLSLAQALLTAAQTAWAPAGEIAAGR